jgi:hypothetical protein
MASAKNFLYAFCGKRKVKPSYNNTNTTDGRFQSQVLSKYFKIYINVGELFTDT